MLDAALLIVLLVLALRAFVALRRESAVRRQFVQPGPLETLVLLYPVGPIALLLGQFVMPQLLLFAIAAALYISAYLVASKERLALECSGTDRTKVALAATSTASLGAMVGFIYVGLSGVLAFVAHAMRSQPIG